MKKFMSYLGVVIFILAACLSGAACSHTPLTQLPTPQDFEFNSAKRTVTWGEVPNASGYVVSFDGTEKETAEPRFALPEGSSYGNYRIGVIALGDHKDYDNSDWANYLFLFEKAVSQGYDSAGWEYTLREDGQSYEISMGNADIAGKITFPSWFKGLPVTRIADQALSFGTDMFGTFTFNIATTGVIIPDTVTEIGRLAFEGLKMLEEIEIPNSVQSIEVGAFSRCLNLKHVTLPENLKVIPAGCFQGCALEEIDFPNGLEEIGESAFNSIEQYIGHGDIELYANKFINIRIPDSVKRIEEQAFSECRDLREIELPSGLEWVGHNAFIDTAWWNAQPDGLILFGDILYAYKGDAPEGTKLTVPSNVKKIVDGAFEQTMGLTEVYIPDGVALASALFYSCKQLKEVRLPSDLTVLPRATFGDCESLSRIEIPSGVTKIEGAAFSRCSSLEHIEIPSGVTVMEDTVFNCCSALKEITLPKSLKSLSNDVFSGCSALKEIVLPASLERIGNYPLYMCENLASVFYEGTEDTWKAINSTDEGFLQLAYSNATIYFLSEDRPQGPGNYWHYVNGVPTVWS